jgi:hypothetical protein
MKKVLLLFVALSTLNFYPASAQETPAGAHFKFDRTMHDFGTIDHKLPKVECTFEFTNDGTEPLVITNARTSCSCTKVSYDKKPVPPGGRGTIKVIYEVSKKESGMFYKTIDIYSNATDRRISLIIKGNAK